jgi:hypothetical protein
VGKRFLEPEHNLCLRINLEIVLSQSGKGEREIRDVLRRRNVGLVGFTDPLQVWNETADSYDGEFAPPRESCGSLDGSVDIAVPVPITGDEVHIRANHYAAIMYLDRAAGGVEPFFDIDITCVR